MHERLTTLYREHMRLTNAAVRGARGYEKGPERMRCQRDYQLALRQLYADEATKKEPDEALLREIVEASQQIDVALISGPAERYKTANWMQTHPWSPVLPPKQG